MQWFGALSVYEAKWLSSERKKASVEAAQATIAACPICNEVGMLEFEDGSVGRCPHELAKLGHIHRQKPIRGFHQA
jgi:hypothetical protein